MKKSTQNKLAKWDAANKILKENKAIESKLRDELVSELFKGKKEGAHLLDLKAGYRLRATIKFTQSLDEDLLKGIFQDLPRGSKKKLIKTKSALIKKGYDALPEEQKEHFDACIITKPSKPALEILEPKEEEEE